MSEQGPGRPIEEMIEGPYALIIFEYLSDGNRKSLARIINEAIRERGYALDKNKTTEAHEKSIRRIIEKLKKVHGKKLSAKILPFRPRGQLPS